MRYYQLFENADYNIARKQYNTLSIKSKEYLKEWGAGLPDWLDKSFNNNDTIAQEIWETGQPIRDNIRNREGDAIKLYRGLGAVKFHENNRVLHSWTSSKNIALFFAGQKKAKYKYMKSNNYSFYDDLSYNEDLAFKNNFKIFTDREIENIINRYYARGYVEVLGRKYVRSKTQPDYYKAYTKNKIQFSINNNIEDEITDEIQDYNNETREMIKIPGMLFEKSIPVDDIVWVLMGEHIADTNDFHGTNENEYIVKGHPR